MKSIGGQAVIEGVMMKSADFWTIAVRDQKGVIHLKKERLKPTPKIFKLPVARGFFALVQALGLGLKAIEYSANTAYEEEDGQAMSGWAMTLTMIFAMVVGAGLFIVLPLYATKLLGLLFEGVEKSSLLFNLTDGVIRVLIFLLYVIGIGLWGEMGRIFMYHGAEHKVIHAYEAGLELTVRNARDYSPLHPRCGTSFLMIVMVVSILIFSFIPQSWPFTYKALSRIILIPLVAGSSYELLKFSAKLKDNPFMNLMIKPGLLLQRLTTREPDDAQIEVALASLLEVLKMEEENA